MWHKLLLNSTSTFAYMHIFADMLIFIFRSVLCAVHYFNCFFNCFLLLFFYFLFFIIFAAINCEFFHCETNQLFLLLLVCRRVYNLEFDQNLEETNAPKFEQEWCFSLLSLTLILTIRSCDQAILSIQNEWSNLNLKKMTLFSSLFNYE